MPGYKDWIDAIDIEVDYFSAFMKAWIAFNAWYNNSGEVEGKTDKDCIEFIAEKTNRFKSYIMNLITADTSEGNIFRENVAGLHSKLLNAAITTQEYLGTRQAISFSEVAVKNSNAREKFEFRNISYECSRAHGKITTVVTDTKNGSELFKLEQDGHDKNYLIQQSSYKYLSPERQRKCLECYEKLKPYRITSVLSSGTGKITFGSYDFVNDPNTISHAIVIILYMLRCCLAHGDVSPDSGAKEVYHFAYEVLCAPLRKLK
ncbi:MAG: hypothetical protein Q3995_02560 [Eubacteriales bacterium]|nr:hypothetical protein [Eubacteriales bacterium]